MIPRLSAICIVAASITGCRTDPRFVGPLSGSAHAALAHPGVRCVVETVHPLFGPIRGCSSVTGDTIRSVYFSNDYRVVHVATRWRLTDSTAAAAQFNSAWTSAADHQAAVVHCDRAVDQWTVWDRRWEENGIEHIVTAEIPRSSMETRSSVSVILQLPTPKCFQILSPALAR